MNWQLSIGWYEWKRESCGANGSADLVIRKPSRRDLTAENGEIAEEDEYKFHSSQIVLRVFCELRGSLLFTWFSTAFERSKCRCPFLETQKPCLASRVCPKGTPSELLQHVLWSDVLFNVTEDAQSYPSVLPTRHNQRGEGYHQSHFQ